jgi:hypothetical protein
VRDGAAGPSIRDLALEQGNAEIVALLRASAAAPQ